MELTSKQRAQLRGMAAILDTIVHVGKDGSGENLSKQVNDGNVKQKTADFMASVKKDVANKQ